MEPLGGGQRPLLDRRTALTLLAAAGGLALAGGIGSTVASAGPRPRWTADVPWRGHPAASAIDDRTLYLYHHEGTVVAVDTEAGVERWTVPDRPHPYAAVDIPALLLSGDAVLIGTGSVVAALDAGTGRRRWELPRFALPLSYPGIAALDGIAVATAPDGLVALDVRTGARIWTAALEHADLADVAARDGRCFSGRAAIGAWDLRTGRQSWAYRPSGDPTFHRIIAVDDVVVAEWSGVGEDSELVVGLDAATGRERWVIPGPFPVWRDAEVVGAMLVLYGDDGSGGYEVRTLDPSVGRWAWSRADPGWNATTTVAGGDWIVCVSPELGVQSAYDAVTGAPLWSHDPGSSGEHGLHAVVAARGRDVYLHVYRGQVRAYRIP